MSTGLPCTATSSSTIFASLSASAAARGGGGAGGGGAVVAAEVDRLALHGDQLLDDLRFVVRQRGGQRGECRLQAGVGVLRGQRLRPVQREVVVAAAVVDPAELARGRLVVVEELRVGRVERVGQHLRALVAGGFGQVFERGGQRQEFAQRIPAQVVFGRELLHVLGRRAAGAGLEQAAAGHQRHDRQHLGAG